MAVELRCSSVLGAGGAGVNDAPPTRVSLTALPLPCAEGPAGAAARTGSLEPVRLHLEADADASARRSYD
jgi:hypothetical protein